MNMSRRSTESMGIVKGFEYAILAAACAATAWFVRWCWKDIAREKRPVVTDDMVELAMFNKSMSNFDTEYDGIIWEDESD